MQRKTTRSRRWLRWTGALVLTGVLGVNIVACLHVRAMTRFSSTGTRTAAPEQLGLAGKLRVLLTGVTIPRPRNTQTPLDHGLAFSAHSYPNPRGDLLEAWHVPAEDPSILVLLFHGYGASKQSLLPIAAELNRAGVSTLLVDFYGSGGSSGTGTTIGMRESEDVTASLAYARTEWPDSRYVLYGLSMGGAAVLRSIAVDSIEPDGVIIEAVFDRMLHTIANRFHAMGLPATPLANLLVFWGGRQAGSNAFRHNPADYASSVGCPTLVLHGTRDRRVTPPQARALFERLAGWKRLSEYPDAGHTSVLQANPERWRRDMDQLMDEIRRGAVDLGPSTANMEPCR